MLLFGLVLATSSSIFIAAPLLLNISALRQRFLERRQRSATVNTAQTR